MRIALAVFLLLSAASACAQAGYHPATQVSGTIRSWGSAEMSQLMTLWERGFHRYHPAVRFEDKLKGTVSGMGGLYGGGADLSLMGREIWPTEAMAYEQMTGHPPVGVEVAIGSFDVPTKADALVVFVHRTNPISALSLVQLRQIFGCGDERTKSIQNWGELGITGPLADKPIHLYGYKPANAAAIFFGSVVLNGSEWHCGLKSFVNRIEFTGASVSTRNDAGQQILDALKVDPSGIAISNPHYANADVKAVALIPADGSTPIPPTKEIMASGAYPLSRAVYIFFNQPQDPAVREFLRYVLSADGQHDVAMEGAYIPLPETVRQEQLKKLP